MAANYRTVLPDAELLQKELQTTRRLLESRVAKQPELRNNWASRRAARTGFAGCAPRFVLNRGHSADP